jgi:hypothetical protein
MKNNDRPRKAGGAKKKISLGRSWREEFTKEPPNPDRRDSTRKGEQSRAHSCLKLEADEAYLKLEARRTIQRQALKCKLPPQNGNNDV